MFMHFYIHGGHPFLKTLEKKTLLFPTVHLTSFLMNIFIITTTQNFFFTIHTFLLSSNHLCFLSSQISFQRFAFMLQRGFHHVHLATFPPYLTCPSLCLLPVHSHCLSLWSLLSSPSHSPFLSYAHPCIHFFLNFTYIQPSLLYSLEQSRVSQL
jgi:hypothetical protein